MKVSVIGGGGRVGSTAAYALQLGGVVKELVLVDIAQDLVQGEALDLRHGAAFSAPQKISAGGYEAAKGSDVVVITAGLRRKPDESRLELISRNVKLFRDILGELKNYPLAEGGIVLVVSNPVDVLTRIAVQELGLDWRKVIGLGTSLDTCRFRSLLAEYFDVAATDVDALILGEHGDSMVPILSSATINGASIQSFPGYSEKNVIDIFEFTKKSGAEVIRLKGGAGYAVGVAIREVVHAIALNSRRTLPVSTLQQGIFGVSDICYSLPTIIGCAGVEMVIEPVCSEAEKKALIKSAEVLKDITKQVM